MKLSFKCPKKVGVFETDKFRLHENHRLVEETAGERWLEGTVTLTSGCPLCGEKHRYQVREVMCFLDSKQDEQSGLIHLMRERRRLSLQTVSRGPGWNIAGNTGRRRRQAA